MIFRKPNEYETTIQIFTSQKLTMTMKQAVNQSLVNPSSGPSFPGSCHYGLPSFYGATAQTTPNSPLGLLAPQSQRISLNADGLHEICPGESQRTALHVDSMRGCSRLSGIIEAREPLRNISSSPFERYIYCRQTSREIFLIILTPTKER